MEVSIPTNVCCPLVDGTGAVQPRFHACLATSSCLRTYSHETSASKAVGATVPPSRCSMSFRRWWPLPKVRILGSLEVPKQSDKIRGGYLTCLLGGPRESTSATQPLLSRGSQNKDGQNQKWPPHRCLLGGPKKGGSATPPLHSWGSPNKGGHNQRWLPHPCLLGGPREGASATQPLLSRGSPHKGTKSEVVASPLPSRGPEEGGSAMQPLRSRGSPNKGEQNQKCVPHPCLLGGPKEGERRNFLGRNAWTSP